MSVSPQSLARTRDKRSHKVPARFTDTVLGSLKDVTEVATRSSTRHRPGSMGHTKRDHDDDGDEKEEVIKVLKMTVRPAAVSHKKQAKTGSHDGTSITPVRPLVEQIDPNSPTTPPPSTTPSPVISVNADPTPAPAATAQQPVSSNNHNISNSSRKESTSSSSTSGKKKSSKGISLIVRQQAVKQDDTHKPVASPRQAPTATISGVSNFNIHRTSNPIQPTNTTPIVVTNVPMSANATAPASGSAPAPAPVATPAPAPAPVPQGRYFNNLTTNQQYGTRLLINEPIYLPRSVATIAPITATLDQIAARARKAPFISKKAEACLAYQDQRKLNYITSNFEALVKITKYLGVRDRLNLRCVNRTWKSVIDCDSVWKEVRVDTNDVDLDLDTLVFKYLNPHRTTDIMFTGYNPLKRPSNEKVYDFGSKLPWQVPSLERIFVKSITSEQNSTGLNLLDGLRRGAKRLDSDRKKKLLCNWEIKVGVDPSGIATVDLKKILVKRQPDFYRPMDSENPECGVASVELYDLKDRYENDLSVEINIKPI